MLPHTGLFLLWKVALQMRIRRRLKSCNGIEAAFSDGLQSFQTRLAEKRRYLLHSHAFVGEDDPGVFVAAGFVGDDVARDGAGGSCPDGGVAALAALVLAVARCRYFGKLVGGAVAHCVKAFAVASPLRHGKAQIAVKNGGLAVSDGLLVASVARMSRVCAKRTQFQFSGSLKTKFQRSSKMQAAFKALTMIQKAACTFKNTRAKAVWQQRSSRRLGR